MGMTIQDVADFLRRYDQDRRNVVNVKRYAAKVSSVDACPGVFGMDFEGMNAAADKAVFFLGQQQRAGILQSLMAGEDVSDEALQEAFGFTMAELKAVKDAENPIKKEIPKNLCVLCFDDAIKSQYTVAVPVLERLGFGATFFITEMEESPRGPGFENKDVYLTWEQIRDMEQRGFEIANHSLHHVFGSQDMGREFNLEQIRGMEEEFARNGISKPVTYAYPSGVSNPTVVQCARDCGYLWGRGNQEKGTDGIRGMTYYDPLVDSPLAVCNFGDPDFYDAAFLKKRIVDTPEGTIFGLTYHDVSPETWMGSCLFEQQMEILKEMDMKVIAMRDLEEYIDPEKAYQYTI